jgi:hypothetical protein
VHRDGLQRSNERNRVGPPRESIVRREMVFRIKIRLASRPGPKTFFSKLLNDGTRLLMRASVGSIGEFGAAAVQSVLARK